MLDFMVVFLQELLFVVSVIFWITGLFVWALIISFLRSYK